LTEPTPNPASDPPPEMPGDPPQSLGDGAASAAWNKTASEKVLPAGNLTVQS